MLEEPDRISMDLHDIINHLRVGLGLEGVQHILKEDPPPREQIHRAIDGRSGDSRHRAIDLRPHQLGL